MTLFDSILLGSIEGITEFLPVSSTAHLILTSHILELTQTDEHILFEIVIQLGAISAVLVMFFNKLLSLQGIRRLFIAFIPTGIAGFFIYPYLKIIFNTPIIIGFTLLIGGFTILFAEHLYSKKEKKNEIDGRHEITFTQAFILGCYQAIAIIPGVSRSGAIIIGGLFHTIERKVLTEFTFLLAVPTILVATCYSLFKKKDLLFAHDYSVAPLVVGFFTSFIVASIVIKFFLEYIKRNSFAPFGFYRIILGAIVIITFL